jgi:hypothetical protein
MAELVDALVSGTSVRKYVQVRVLFWAHFLYQAQVAGPTVWKCSGETFQGGASMRVASATLFKE